MPSSSDRVTCDVLVAGSGAAGFAAALTARLAGLDVLMVEKEPLFGGTTAYSAGVIWIPANALQRAAGIADSREQALTYLAHHVGNRLDRAKAEAYVDSAPAMLDLFEREGFVAYTLAPTWADYHPDEPGASQGGRSLVPDEYDGRKLGAWFPKLRPALKTMMPLGGMMVGRNDLPHVFQMTRSAASALHVARMVARHARDRLTHSRGTRLVNGNALIAKLAVQRLRSRHPPMAIDANRRAGARGRAHHRRHRRARRAPHSQSPHAAASCSPAAASRPAVTRSGASTAHVSKQASLPPPGNTGDGLRLAQIGRRHLPRRGAPARRLDAGIPGAAARRIDGPVPALLRARQARLHQRRPPRPALRQRGQVLSRVRAGPDRGLPRRSRRRGLDRLRPPRHPPLRPGRAGPGAHAHRPLRAVRLHQARRHAPRPRQRLRHRSRRAWRAPLPPSTGRRTAARTPSSSAAATPTSASTAPRAMRPTPASPRSRRRPSMPSASSRASSARSPASPPTPTPRSPMPTAVPSPASMPSATMRRA